MVGIICPLLQTAVYGFTGRKSHIWTSAMHCTVATCLWWSQLAFSTGTH